jgi:hypothetical protein
MTNGRALMISLLLVLASVPLMFLSAWFAIVFLVGWLGAMVLVVVLLVAKFFTPQTWKARLVIRRDDR